MEDTFLEAIVHLTLPFHANMDRRTYLPVLLLSIYPVWKLIHRYTLLCSI